MQILVIFMEVLQHVWTPPYCPHKSPLSIKSFGEHYIMSYVYISYIYIICHLKEHIHVLTRIFKTKYFLLTYTMMQHKTGFGSCDCIYFSYFRIKIYFFFSIKWSYQILYAQFSCLKYTNSKTCSWTYTFHKYRK